MKLAGHVTGMGKLRNAYKILIRKPVDKRPRGSPRCRWEDNIRMALEKYGGKVWTGFIWLKVGTCDGFL
jgi:hypothetical protein